MPNLSPQLFEILKDCVLLKSNIKSITPSDCKMLSSNIFTETKYTVSETTLKRVYGFAHSKFKPSLFTINVLAKYCGYSGWVNFCAKQNEQLPKANHNLAWTKLKANATKITNFTLQALKNRSGIPYKQTIKRNFINEHFDEFLSGDYNATLIYGPAGYGKTIGLCHWIDEKLEEIANDENNNIILFFSSSALMNIFLSGRDLNEWVLALLGYNIEDDLSILFDNSAQKEGNFFLIIDGLDEHMFKNDQFEILLDQLMDIFSFYESQKWFKLVLTMRSSNWIFDTNSLQINKKWFTGFVNSDLSVSNVPLFNFMEIKELIYKIDPTSQNSISIETAKNFSHPLYLQFFYKQHKENFPIGTVDHVSVYDLVSSFIINKINQGHHATEKVLLLKGLVEAMDFKNNVYNLNKIKINDLLKQYGHAYHELINVGFLREINTSDFNYNTYVQFYNNDFLEFTIANKLFRDNNQQFDEHLIQIVNYLFNSNPRKVNIYKWCVIHAINAGQQDNFYLLSETQLNHKEKFELIVFLGDLIDNKSFSSNYTELNDVYFINSLNDNFFYYFFGLELISYEYEKVLKNLLKFALSDDKKILCYTALSLIAIHQLDMNKLEENYFILKQFPAEQYAQFPINPLNSVDMLYHCFKYGVFKKDFYVEITRFYFNPPKLNPELKSQVRDFLYYLTIVPLIIARRPLKTLRFLRAIKQMNNAGSEPSFEFSFIFEIIAADAHFQQGDEEKFNHLFNALSDLFKKKESAFIPYLRGMFYNFMIKRTIIAKDYAKIDNYLKFANSAMDESGSKVGKVVLANMISRIPDLAIIDPKLYKQVNYDKAKILRESGVCADLFNSGDLVNQEMLVKVEK